MLLIVNPNVNFTLIMEKYEYICHYCGKEYVPRRRHVQRYCCTSCRVNAFNRRNKTSPTDPMKGLSIPQKEEKNEQKISMAGIGNAAIAIGATDFVKTIFTKEENKPATKGDLQGMLSKIQLRYMPISNMPNRGDGARPFYDSGTETVVFRHQLSSLNLNETNKPKNFQSF